MSCLYLEKETPFDSLPFPPLPPLKQNVKRVPEYTDNGVLTLPLYYGDVSRTSERGMMMMMMMVHACPVDSQMTYGKQK